jgi:hypothetical protein
MLGCIDMASETKGRSNCGAGGARALYRRSDSGVEPLHDFFKEANEGALT